MRALISIPLGLALVAALGACDRQESHPPARPRAPAGRTPHTGPAAAEQALLARLANDPADVTARLALANLYYDTDRPHRAVPNYLEILKHRPDDPAVRTDLGTCYKRMGLLGEARAAYELVLEKHPDHVHATYNLAVVSQLAGDQLRAAELWERAAALAPGTPVGRAALDHAAEARRAASQRATPSTTTPARKDPRP